MYGTGWCKVYLGLLSTIIKNKMVRNSGRVLVILSQLHNHYFLVNIENEREKVAIQDLAQSNLKERTKGQKLIYEEKKELYKQINDGIPIKDIVEIWQVSYSTIKRIQKDAKLDRLKKSNSKIKSKSIRNSSLWRVIFKYVEQNKWAFIWKDVQEYLIKSEGVWVDIGIVRRILKEKLNYTYRRCSSRPLMINWRILKLRKSLLLWSYEN